MAYTFLQIQKIAVGASFVEDRQLASATDILDRAQIRGVKIVLPEDHIIADDFRPDAKSALCERPEIKSGWQGLDIGPRTTQIFEDHVRDAKTVFWNGPLGVFEWDAFSKGTDSIAHAVAKCEGYTGVGGGDSAAAIEKAGVCDDIDHLSTGGGASLAFLENPELVGLKALSS